MGNKVIHMKITPEKYHNSLSHDPNTVYYTTNGELYVGDIQYGGKVHTFDNQSIPMNPSPGTVYANIDTKEILMWKNGKWVNLTPLPSSRIPTGAGDYEEEQNGDVVTVGALRQYISDLISSGQIAGGYDGPIANVPAKVIRLTKDIPIIDQKIGRYRPGDVVKAGTNIEDILANIFTRVIDVEYKTPTVKISPMNIKVEAGSTNKFIFKLLYDKADGGEVESVLFLKGMNNTYGDPIFNSKYLIREWTTPDPITITDSDTLQYKVIVKYKDGAIKSNNIGEEVPDGVIKAGQVEDVCNCIGERFTWYQSSAIGNLQYDKSSEIRGLSDKILGVKKGHTFSVDISRGDRQVVIAYPKINGPIESIRSRTLSMDIKNNFDISTVMVEGANGYRAIPYYVYKYTPATPFTSYDTFDVVL